MENPQRDVPVAVLRSAITGILHYAIPIPAIILVLPAEKVTGIGGFLDAVYRNVQRLRRRAGLLLGVITVCFVGTLLRSGAVWMIGFDRILAVSACDGGFPAFFGKFSARFGTPVRVNVMSGVVAAVYMVVAVAAFSGGTDSKFVVVLDIAISTTLISYLWIFPAAVKRRYAYGQVRRPYRVPYGRLGMWTAGVLTTFWIALGSWVAVFPGTFEELFGLGYDFEEEWGVDRGAFEALTLGTLALILVIALVGYALSRDVRARAVEIALATDTTVTALAR